VAKHSKATKTPGPEEKKLNACVAEFKGLDGHKDITKFQRKKLSAFVADFKHSRAKKTLGNEKKYLVPLRLSGRI